jgi:hypothetical protein
MNHRNMTPGRSTRGGGQVDVTHVDGHGFFLGPNAAEPVTTTLDFGTSVRLQSRSFDVHISPTDYVLLKDHAQREAQQPATPSPKRLRAVPDAAFRNGRREQGRTYTGSQWPPDKHTHPPAAYRTRDSGLSDGVNPDLSLSVTLSGGDA